MDKLQLTADFKESLKKGDSLRVSVLRMILAEIKNKEIDNKGDLSEEQILEVVSHEVKKHKDSIEAYSQAGRNDLTEAEEKELVILMEFMPQQLSAEEVRKIVEKKKEALGVTNISEMGKLMGAVMPALKGKADGNLVKKVVEELLK